MSEASDIVRQLLTAGFSQTDIARGLGLVSKGSGSYVGQVARGTKGANKLGELRALLDVARGAESIPQGRGRAATQARQDLLGGVVQHQPRQRKAGGAAAVRKPATRVSSRGFVKAVAGKQSLASTGGRPIENAVRALGQYPGGRFAFTIVGRFPKASPAHRSQYWQRFYGKRKHAPARKRGSANVLQASFGGAGNGFSAAEWVTFMDDAGSFLGAFLAYAVAAGWDLPEVVLRVEMTGWGA